MPIYLLNIHIDMYLNIDISFQPIIGCISQLLSAYLTHVQFQFRLPMVNCVHMLYVYSCTSLIPIPSTTQYIDISAMEFTIIDMHGCNIVPALLHNVHHFHLYTPNVHHLHPYTPPISTTSTHTHPPASTMSTTSTHTHPPPPHSAPHHLLPYMYHRSMIVRTMISALLCGKGAQISN